MEGNAREWDECSSRNERTYLKGFIVHKAIVVFEVEGGSDKYFDGHRKDTMPIVNAIKEKGWNSEVVYFRPEWSEDIFEYVSNNFDAYISRVNPGNIPGGEKGYFCLLYTSPSPRDRQKSRMPSSA